MNSKILNSLLQIRFCFKNSDKKKIFLDVVSASSGIAPFILIPGQNFISKIKSESDD
jgi:hypothetical protein